MEKKKKKNWVVVAYDWETDEDEVEGWFQTREQARAYARGGNGERVLHREDWEEEKKEREMEEGRRAAEDRRLEDLMEESEK